MKLLFRSFLLLIPLLFTWYEALCQQNDSIVKILPEICLSENEQQLYKKVNEYRVRHGLNPVPLSKSLTYVAQNHVWDLATNAPASAGCNLHSWSQSDRWQSCCYTPDHLNASCMWNKPRELTNYTGDGYEIAYWTNEKLSPEEFAEKAVKGWKQSDEHNRVILNRGKWNQVTFKAMGVGYRDGYAVVWFGIITDPEDEIHACVN